MKTQAQTELRLLDDGEFYVLLDSDQAPEIAGGFLERRCLVSPSTPGGFECIGAFTKQMDGQWDAKVAKPVEASNCNDFAVVAMNAGRSSAIVALWRARFVAFSGHTAR